MSTGFVFSLVVLAFPFAADSPRPVDSILGTWEGESICTLRDSPCHDEHVIYEISHDSASGGPVSKDAGPDWKMDAYKIVDGKKDFMGSLPCSFDDKKQTLSCFTKTRTEGYWEFLFAGDSFTGTLHTGPEKTLFRKISAKRISKK